QIRFCLSALGKRRKPLPPSSVVCLAVSIVARGSDSRKSASFSLQKSFRQRQCPVSRLNPAREPRSQLRLFSWQDEETSVASTEGHLESFDIRTVIDYGREFSGRFGEFQYVRSINIEIHCEP